MSSINIFGIKKEKKIKREFSLEKIAQAINFRNLLDSIRNKYIDPLIKRHKNKLPKIKSMKKIKRVQQKDPFSLNKILIHKLLQNKQKQKLLQNEQNYKSTIEIEGEKAIQTKNIISNGIFSKIQRNLSHEELNNKISDPLLITSGAFKGKNFYNNHSKKIKLYNIINKKSRNLFDIISIYPKIDSIKEMNDKFNVQLNLNYLNNNNTSVKKPNKMNNRKRNFYYLFKKYVTSSPTGINNDIMNTIHKSRKKKKNYRKCSLSINNNKNDVLQNTVSSNNSESIDLFKKELLGEDKKTFLTKLDIEKDEKRETIDIEDRNKKRRKLKNLQLFENNKNIINYDQKIFIDCLRSHANSKIQKNKLMYKYINKTTFKLQKDPSYKKIKKFESKIDKLIKTQ